MRILLIISSAVLIFFGVILSPRQQEAQAFDPVIASTLAPVATKAFKEMHPYMVKGLSSGGRHMVSMGKDVFEIFLLPWGVVQATVGLPFGGFGSGVKNMVQGGVAPFKFAFKAVLLPFAFMGIKC